MNPGWKSSVPLSMDTRIMWQSKKTKLYSYLYEYSIIQNDGMYFYWGT